MESKLKFGLYLRKNFFNFLNKTNNKFKLTNLLKLTLLKKSQLLLGLTSGIFLSSYNLNNKSYCESELENTNISDLEKRIKVVQINANNPIEDKYIAVKLQNLEGTFLAIFDGHGGDSNSTYASEKMAELFERAKTLYNKGERKLGGSCALVVLATKEKLYIAQLGDSKAKLYKKIEDRIISQKLTKTYNAAKYHQQLHLFKTFTDLDVVICKKDLNKVCYVKGRLQPTRSFGDFHLKSRIFNRNDPSKGGRGNIVPFNGPYISAVPDFKIHTIEKNDFSFIMATDGFWDNFKSDEVAKIIEKNLDLDSEKLINLLLKSSLLKDAQSSNISIIDMLNLPDAEKRKYFDDTTIIYYNIKI